MSGCAILVEGLEVVAGGKTILGPLDLALESGEYLCILGHSGSGKSTLLRAIAGLVEPARGRVSLGGELVSGPGKVLVPPERRRIGMLFQEGALWPHMSVGRTLAFALSCAGVPRAERAGRVGHLLDEVRLSGFEDRKPGTLSGGEAQRLALARALAPSPRVLLLDEPLGPLDAELRNELCDVLQELHSRFGFTALHVTHDAAEPARVGARTLELERGRWKEVES